RRRTHATLATRRALPLTRAGLPPAGTRQLPGAPILILAHLVATSSWPDLFRPSIAAPCGGDGRNKSSHDVERPYRPTKTRIAVGPARRSHASALSDHSHL